MRTDAELILASQHDPEAFCELYDRWAEPLLGFFARRVRDPDVAADLVAETLAVVFAKRSRFRDLGRPGSAWLYAIAGRQLSRYWRRRTVELRTVQRLGMTVPVLDDESRQAIEAMIDREAHELRLADAISGMPPAEREAVELRVIQELGYREIALALNCSVVAARVRVHRGLARLNKAMEVSV
jgi:RNA polymerase sigma-70 factor (ECF subfamily)